MIFCGVSATSAAYRPAGAGAIVAEEHARVHVVLLGLVRRHVAHFLRLSGGGVVFVFAPELCVLGVRVRGRRRGAHLLRHRGGRRARREGVADGGESEEGRDHNEKLCCASELCRNHPKMTNY